MAMKVPKAWPLLASAADQLGVGLGHGFFPQCANPCTLMCHGLPIPTLREQVSPMLYQLNEQGQALC